MMLKRKTILTPCWRCGAKISVGTNRIPLCGACEQQYVIEQKREAEQYKELRQKLMFKKMLSLLEKQKNPVDTWTYKAVADRLNIAIINKEYRFDSAHEMLAALELAKAGIHIETHRGIGRYDVDITLPNERIILEIDGQQHQRKLSVDAQRDADIRNNLGLEWEIVRISTKYIEENIRQLYATLIEKKRSLIRQRRMRQENLSDHALR